MNRLQMLQAMVGSKPNDPFARYGLAMEHRKLGQRDEAWREFETLLRESPGYVPTYLMAGQLLGELGRVAEAQAVLTRGVEVARDAGDTHTVSELESARAGLS